MKTIFQKVISVFLVFALMNLQGFANVNIYFSSSSENAENEFTNFDEDAFYQEFDEVSELEAFLLDSELSYSELEESGSELIANVSADPMMPFTDDGGSEGPALGIPSFLWGCVFGLVGLLIVYLMTESKVETKKALWGCIATTAVGIVVWVIVAAAATTATVSTGYH